MTFNFIPFAENFVLSGSFQTVNLVMLAFLFDGGNIRAKKEATKLMNNHKHVPIRYTIFQDVCIVTIICTLSIIFLNFLVYFSLLKIHLGISNETGPILLLPVPSACHLIGIVILSRYTDLYTFGLVLSDQVRKNCNIA